MNRRSFFGTVGVAGLGTAVPQIAVPAPVFQAEKSKLKITGVRLVKTTPKRPAPAYEPAPGSWSTGRVEVANPMSIYPEYKPMRSLFMANDPSLGGFTLEVTTDQA